MLFDGAWRPVGDAVALLLNHPGHSSQKSHGRRGAGAMHDEATIRAAFDFVDVPTGLRAEVTAIRGSGRPELSIYVDVAVIDRSGNLVGNVVRTIRPADQATVRHDGMAMMGEFQRQGFATRFNAHAEAVYREHGITRVTTWANYDVGGYSNARAGFDFASDGGDSRAGALAHVTAQAGRYGAAVQSEVSRLARSPNVTPVELAMIGHTPGATMWPGKEMMLGSAWEGVKVL